MPSEIELGLVVAPRLFLYDEPGAPFAVRGVPCIFLENQEGDAFPYYHTPADDMKTICFDSYIPVFKLVTEFIRRDSH